MKNIDLVKILDKLGICEEVVIKDSFGITNIKNVYYDEKEKHIVIEID